MWTVSPDLDGTPGTGGTGRQIPGGLFLCAGAVLESHRLAVGFPRTTFFLMRPRIVQSHPQSSPKATPRRPNAASDGQSASQDWPKFPNETPKVLQRETKGGQRSPQNTPEQFKLSSKEIYIHPNSRSTAAAATIHINFRTDLSKIVVQIRKSICFISLDPGRPPLVLSASL